MRRAPSRLNGRSGILFGEAAIIPVCRAKYERIICCVLQAPNYEVTMTTLPSLAAVELIGSRTSSMSGNVICSTKMFGGIRSGSIDKNPWQRLPLRRKLART
jgi:hypothetical protein